MIFFRNILKYDAARSKGFRVSVNTRPREDCEQFSFFPTSYRKSKIVVLTIAYANRGDKVEKKIQPLLERNELHFFF